MLGGGHRGGVAGGGGAQNAQADGRGLRHPAEHSSDDPGGRIGGRRLCDRSVHVLHGLAAGEGVAALDFKIPTSIVLGVAGGVACGWVLAELFRRVHMRDSVKVVLLLSTSFCW